MSVFCSNTLIFAPECWKCILDTFKFFQELALTSHAFAVSLFPSSPTPRLLPSTQNLIKNPDLTKPFLYSSKPKKPTSSMLRVFICFNTIFNKFCLCLFSDVIKSGIGFLVWFAGLTAWILIYQKYRASWGATGDMISFVIPLGEP